MHYNIYDSIKGFTGKCKSIWYGAGSAFPTFTASYSKDFRKRNGRNLEQFLETVFSDLKALDSAGGRSDELSDKIRANCIAASKNIFGYKPDHIDIFMEKPFSKVTGDFIRQALSFDCSIKLENIFQAVRNVWIMNVLQIFLNMEVSLTPSIFAYSMLYPYTDNFLDDTGIPLQEKRKLYDRFGQRLEGVSLTPENEHEKKLFDLVGMIEEQYSRKENPQAYQGVTGIYLAQKKSLLQQSGSMEPYQDDILGISFEKGGISVLADGYLVNPCLTAKEAFFMFGFGAFLQLADDLEDCLGDAANSHATIFSQGVHFWKLDALTNRTINFMRAILEEDKAFTSPQHLKLKETIFSNMAFLIFKAVSENRRSFSKSYLAELEEYSRFQLSYLGNLSPRVKAKYRKLQASEKVSMERIILQNL